MAEATVTEIPFSEFLRKQKEDRVKEAEKKARTDKVQAAKDSKRLEKIADCIYDTDYISCRKELWSKLHSKAYELQYKCDFSNWLKTFRRDPHK